MISRFKIERLQDCKIAKFVTPPFMAEKGKDIKIIGFSQILCLKQDENGKYLNPVRDDILLEKKGIINNEIPLGMIY